MVFILVLLQNGYEDLRADENLHVGWPLFDPASDKVLLHLADPPRQRLKVGHAYFVLQTNGQGVKVILKEVTDHDLVEATVLECSYGHLVAMEWTDNLPPGGDAGHYGSDLCALLQHSLLAAKEGVNGMTLDKVNLQIKPKKGTAEEGMQVDTCDWSVDMTPIILPHKGITLDDDQVMEGLPNRQSPSQGKILIMKNHLT